MGSMGSTKGGRGKPKSSKSVFRSQKAGLQFPVGRLALFLEAGKYADRVGAGVPVYLSAGLEYLAAEESMQKMGIRKGQIINIAFNNTTLARIKEQ